MVIRQIVTALETYKFYKTKLDKAKSKLITYKIENGDYENNITRSMRKEIINAQRDLNKILDVEV